MDCETRLAYDLLKGSPELIADAEVGAPLGNSVAGALLCTPIGPIGARQYAEQAVRNALALLAREGKGKGKQK